MASGIPPVTPTERAGDMSPIEVLQENLQKLEVNARSARSWTNEKVALAKAKTLAIASDRAVQVTAASAVGGAAVVGSAGASTGFLAGGAIGAALGVIPALLTFGLSIPVGAAIGSGCGLVAGGAIGSVTGFVGGGAAGFGAYKNRDFIEDYGTQVYGRVAPKIAPLMAKWILILEHEISEMIVIVEKRAVAFKANMKGKYQSVAVSLASAAHAAKGKVSNYHVQDKFQSFSTSLASAARAAKEKAALAAAAVKAKTSEAMADKGVKVTAASAAAGAVVVGAGGAATGMAAGGVLGAGLGLFAAPLTFGLSIPFGAVLGGGCGFASGAALGGAAGGVGGGAVGYAAYSKRQLISSAAVRTTKRVDSFSKLVKDTALDSATYVHAKLVDSTVSSLTPSTSTVPSVAPSSYIHGA